MPHHSHPMLLIIGGGNMAHATLRGALGDQPGRGPLLDPRRVLVVEPNPARHPALAALGVGVSGLLPHALTRIATTMDDDDASPPQILLAIKPQQLADVARESRGEAWLAGKVVISILAGTPTEKVRAALGPNTRIVRVMPNLPASLRQGATAVALGAGAIPGDERFAMRLFAGVGPLVLRLDETLMDAFTAVAGSGPAYLFYLAEAMIQAAESLGFTPADARAIVAQTILGAAQMVAQPGSPDPAALRASVTSKGGTTAAAIATLDSSAVKDVMVAAITAARDRGRELAAS